MQLIPFTITLHSTLSVILVTATGLDAFCVAPATYTSTPRIAFGLGLSTVTKRWYVTRFGQTRQLETHISESNSEVAFAKRDFSNQRTAYYIGSDTPGLHLESLHNRNSLLYISYTIYCTHFSTPHFRSSLHNRVWIPLSTRNFVICSSNNFSSNSNILYSFDVRSAIKFFQWIHRPVVRFFMTLSQQKFDFNEGNSPLGIVSISSFGIFSISKK